LKSKSDVQKHLTEECKRMTVSCKNCNSSVAYTQEHDCVPALLKKLGVAAKKEALLE
jgi:hypothetical protein